MATFRGDVYEASQVGMPLIAVIISSDGEVIFAKAVKTTQEGEALIVHMAKGMQELAEKDHKNRKK